MQLPEDYVLDILKQLLDGKIDSIEKSLKNEINSLKNEIHDFHSVCRIEMKDHEKRIRSNEDFKLKIIAISGAIGTLSALIFTILVKFLGT